MQEMASVPGNRTVNTSSELAAIDAPIGTEIWVVDDQQNWQAVPREPASGGIAGPSTSLRMWWAPADVASGRFGPFSSIAEFRAATPPSTWTEVTIEGVGSGIYKHDDGANMVDDSLYVIRPTAVAADANGAFFLRSSAVFGPFASIADFRSETPPSVEAAFLIAGKMWRFVPTETGADDGLNFLKPTATDVGDPGRAVPVYAAGVAAGFAGPDVALTTDSVTALLTMTLTGLTASRKYLATIVVRVSIWQEGTESNCGDLDCKFGAYITTDASAVATVTLLTTPDFDGSLVATALSTTVASVIASTGGFTISATRPSAVSCSAAAEWWCARVRDIT